MIPKNPPYPSWVSNQCQ